MPNQLDNVTPGKILNEDFLAPIGITPTELAKATAIPEDHLTEILNGQRKIEAEIDLRLCRYFSLTEGYWLRLQTTHDLTATRRQR